MFYSDVYFLGHAPPSLQSLGLVASVDDTPRPEVTKLAAMSELTQLELAYVNQNLDVSKFCSPRPQELSLICSPIANSAFLAPGGLQHLEKFHCEEGQSSAPNPDIAEADTENAQQYRRLLELPHLKIISGDCKIFTACSLEQSNEWQQSEYSAQDESILLKNLRRDTFA